MVTYKCLCVFIIMNDIDKCKKNVNKTDNKYKFFIIYLWKYSSSLQYQYWKEKMGSYSFVMFCIVVIQLGFRWKVVGEMTRWLGGSVVECSHG